MIFIQIDWSTLSEDRTATVVRVLCLLYASPLLISTRSIMDTSKKKDRSQSQEQKNKNPMGEKGKDKDSKGEKGKKKDKNPMGEKR